MPGIYERFFRAQCKRSNISPKTCIDFYRAAIFNADRNIMDLEEAIDSLHKNNLKIISTVKDDKGNDFYTSTEKDIERVINLKQVIHTQQDIISKKESIIALKKERDQLCQEMDIPLKNDQIRRWMK